MAVAGLLAAACTTAVTTPLPAGAIKPADLMVVDCLLSGQIRQLGGKVTYVTAGRAIKTSARDCAIRGGEYVAFDRANYATALKVWLPQAEQGDANAQTYVGEIFEKGLGVAPDFGAAAQWYRRAAERGYSRAALNLGSLYERGLGVPKDTAQALNWYRRAAGLGELTFDVVPAAGKGELQALRAQVEQLRRELEAKSAALGRVQRELDDTRRALESRGGEVAAERDTIAALRRELEQARRREGAGVARARDLERSIAGAEARLAAKEREMADLRAAVARLETESREQRDRLERLRQQTATSGKGALAQRATVDSGPRVGLPKPRTAIAFGQYHALVIGSNDYKLLPRLKTAVNDATEVARILERQYSFRVRLLTNATRYDILSALNELRENLTERDNLLIYYAGHGEVDERNQRGHWLPVDAEPTSSANWISNVAVTDVLNAMSVQQLVVIADSCYAGTLTRSSLGRLEAGLSDGERLRLMQVLAQKRSRMVMTSGGVEPVLDSSGGPHSAFAQAFLELLESNVGVLAGQEMFNLLRLRVASVADRVHMRQVPEYAPIKFAGHESGDFFFVRTAAN